MEMLPPPLSSQQLPEARTPQDDWTGLRDRAERRRIQTRLNVRAHRRRKMLERARGGTSHTLGHVISSQEIIVPKDTICHKDGIESEGVKETALCSGIVVARLFNPSTLPTLFPLSHDHLIPLLRYNILRAIMTNAQILQQTLMMSRSCMVEFSQMPLFPHVFSLGVSQIPPGLAPTALQKATPHLGWIDLLPHPRLRDNILREIPEEEGQQRLLAELNGDYGEKGDSQSTIWLKRPGVVAWDTPWRMEGFELAEEFVSRWGRLLRGCGDVVATTNQWRAARGERPIIVEVE